MRPDGFRIRPCWLVGLPLLAGAGVLVWIAPVLSEAVVPHWGARIVALGNGKFSDAGEFVRHRLREIGGLTAAAVLLVGAVAWLGAMFARRVGSLPYRGLGCAVGALLALNAWVALAETTALPWLALFKAGQVDNYVAYQIKKHLLPEQVAARHAFLLGNSQTRAALSEELLNAELAPALWTTELHQPGCHGFDTSLIVHDLRDTPCDLAIIYLSEIFVHGRENAIVTPNFFRWRDLGPVWETGSWDLFPPGAIRAGLIGEALPLFRLRPSLCQRLYGEEFANLPQVSFEQAAQRMSATEDIRRRAEVLLEGRATALQKFGFERALTELVSRGASVLVLAGSTNPVLRAREDPGVRQEVEQWTEGLTRRWPGRVVVVREETLFTPTAQDYADMVHLNPGGQEKLTRALAGYLRRDDWWQRR